MLPCLPGSGVPARCLFQGPSQPLPRPFSSARCTSSAAPPPAPRQGWSPAPLPAAPGLHVRLGWGRGWADVCILASVCPGFWASSGRTPAQMLLLPHRAAPGCERPQGHCRAAGRGQLSGARGLCGFLRAGARARARRYRLRAPPQVSAPRAANQAGKLHIVRTGEGPAAAAAGGPGLEGRPPPDRLASPLQAPLGTRTRGFPSGWPCCWRLWPWSWGPVSSWACVEPGPRGSWGAAGAERSINVVSSSLVLSRLFLVPETCSRLAPPSPSPVTHAGPVRVPRVCIWELGLSARERGFGGGAQELGVGAHGRRSPDWHLQSARTARLPSQTGTQSPWGQKN